jgi:hypothetical protein
MFMQERQAFMLAMRSGINACIRKARRLDKQLCVRLNGATDITWESVKMEGIHGRFTIIDLFPTVQFVDYTKNFKRMLRFCNHMLPKNYHLTFSRSEDNEAQCREVLKQGGNVAVVFAGEFPEHYLGHRVVNGDEHDLRHLDRSPEDKDRYGGLIIGLSPKGRKAKNDTSGFVVRS